MNKTSKNIIEFCKEKDYVFKYLTISLLLIYVIFRMIFVFGGRTPWYDEVYYVSPALDYLHNGTIHIIPDYPRTPEGAICWNTPMFSYIYSLIFDWFGFSFASVRIPGLLGGLFIFFSFLCYVYKMTKSWIALFVYVLFFITDKTIDPALFTARPDILSFVFYICSIVLMNNSLKQSVLWKKYLYMVSAGVLLAIGMTISIRLLLECVLFIFLPFLYMDNDGKRKIFDILVYGVVAVVCIFLIYAYVLGDFSLIFNSAESTTNNGMFSRHFGFDPYKNILRTPYNALKFIVFYLIFLYLIFKNKFYIRKNFIILSNVFFVFGFTFLIKEVGRNNSAPYSMVLLPIVYVVFAYVFYLLLNSKPRYFYVCLVVAGLIFLTNLATFMPRFCFLVVNPNIVTYENKLEQTLAPYLTKNDVVCGLPRFYFMTRPKVKDFYISPLLGGHQFHLKRLATLLKEKKCNIYIGEEPNEESSKVINVELIKELPMIEYNGFLWQKKRYAEKHFGVYKIIYEDK